VEDLGEFLATTLSRQWRNFRKQRQSCRKRLGPDAVHDLRVAARRLIATLEVVDDIADGNRRVRKARRWLKKQLGRFGPLRDAHIQLERVDALLVSYPQLKGFRDALVEREQKLSRRCRKKLEQMSIARIKKRLGAIEKQLAGFRADTPQSRLRHAALASAIEKAFFMVQDRRGQLRANSPATVHHLRVAFKGYRYRVETLQPLLEGVTEFHLERMRSFQRVMGDIQDVNVLSLNLEKFAREQKRADRRLLAPVHKELTRQNHTLIQTLMKNADTLAERWHPRLRRIEGAPLVVHKEAA
jgi:CHAD domain-containing protein